MVYTLQRYILRELLRVFVLALVALTLILSLGSILQPVQEYGAGPRQVIFLMVYFLPITLTFVLPMAALFAGALVYGRFTSDNELDACRASGISVQTLVYPGLFLAIVVAIVNLLLSFQVMPIFVHLAEKSLKGDIKQMLFRSIQQKGFYELPTDKDYQYLIYADDTDERNDTLSGVVVVRVKNNKIEQVTTAQSAQIKIFTNQNVNEVQVIAKNTYQMDSEGVLFIGSLPLTKEFGSLLGDDIKFKTIDEMRRIHNDMMQFDPIAQQAYETFSQLTVELLALDINRRISETAEQDDLPLGIPDQAGYFYELYGEPNSIRFAATQCTAKDREVELSGEITVIEYDTESNTILHILSCKQASLNIETDRPKPTLEMDIRSALVEGSNQLKMRHIIRGLNPPASIETITNQFRTENGSLNTEKLVSDLSGLSGFQPGRQLKDMQGGLKRKIQKTNVEIKAEIHSRLVFGTGCIAMILIGIGLGILKRGGHLLSAFGASCVPAAVLIVCIMSGKQLTENLGAQTVSGVGLMWAGLGLLCLLAFAIYYQLLRH